MKIAMGCDEAALAMKEAIKDYIENQGHEVEDFGVYGTEAILYPDIAIEVAESVASGDYVRGILFCGTGVGMAIVANKVLGIRAAVCHDPFSAERARKSNDAQIMTMGARVIGIELAKKLVDIWLASEFAGGRSLPKVARIKEYEKNHMK